MRRLGDEESVEGMKRAFGAIVGFGTAYLFVVALFALFVTVFGYLT